MSERNRGFTLIELMIVVAIIGIIAAIAIPNFLDGIERARQKRSVSEIRTMVMGLQSFSVDYGGYPNSSHIGEAGVVLPLVFDVQGDSIIVPDLIQAVPRYDGWNTSYYFFSGPDGVIPNPKIQGGEVTAGHYCVYSLGADKDALPEVDGAAPANDVVSNWCLSSPIAIGTQQTFCYESDIVWGDSSFQQSPEGKQRHC